MNIYQENGYESRRDYLESLASEYDMHVDDVFALASLLGPNEDFDGLVTAVQDAAGC